MRGGPFHFNNSDDNEGDGPGSFYHKPKITWHLLHPYNQRLLEPTFSSNCTRANFYLVSSCTMAGLYTVDDVLAYMDIPMPEDDDLS